MSELTLDALGFRAEEAEVARRIHELTTPRQRRAAVLRQILRCESRSEPHPAPQEEMTVIQHQEKHPAGTFPPCRECGHEPRHIVGQGSTSRETFSILRPTGTRHQLECRCAARTAWLPSLAEALSEWKRHHAEQMSPRASRANVQPLFRHRRDAI